MAWRHKGNASPQCDTKTRWFFVCTRFYQALEPSMAKHCVAAGCSNTYKDNVSLFSFPRDPALRECWTKQVRRTCAGWSRPKVNSYLCSDHFSEDCFEKDTLMTAKLGIQKHMKLKSDAVPTIFHRAKQHAAPPSSKKRTASAESNEPECSYAARKA